MAKFGELGRRQAPLQWISCEDSCGLLFFSEAERNSFGVILATLYYGIFSRGLLGRPDVVPRACRHDNRYKQFIAELVEYKELADRRCGTCISDLRPRGL